MASRMFRTIVLLAMVVAFVVPCLPAAGQPYGISRLPAPARPNPVRSVGPTAADRVDFTAYFPNNGRRTTGNYDVAPYNAAPYGTAPYGPAPYSAAPSYAPYGVDDGCNGACGPTCYPETCVDACEPPPPVWTGKTAGLLLSIDTGSHYNFSYDVANEADQYTDWHNTEIEWEGGFEVVLRRFDACSCNGFEFVYWQLAADPVSTSTVAADVAGNLNGILNWDQLDYNGMTADTYVDNAMIHRLRREVDVYNVEFSHVLCLSQSDCSTGKVQALFGARVLRFDDKLQFASDTINSVFTSATEELYYDIEAENTLYGLQAGVWSEYCLSSRWSLAIGAKAGVYGNHISAFSHISGAAGTATVNNGPNSGRQFRVDVEKDDLAMLAELQLELQFAMTPSWHTGLGYRAIGVSGVALSVDQIYSDLRGLQDIEQVDSDSTLLLHGLRAYVERRF